MILDEQWLHGRLHSSIRCLLSVLVSFLAYGARSLPFQLAVPYVGLLKAVPLRKGLVLLFPSRIELMFLVEVIELRAPLHIPLLPLLKGQ